MNYANLRKLNLNLLLALDALLTTSSVTRASEQMKVTQSAMSGSLSMLRTYFNDPLLVPVGKKLYRTTLAEQMAEPLRAVLSELEALAAMKPGFEPISSQRTFRIMASEYGVST